VTSEIKTSSDVTDAQGFAVKLSNVSQIIFRQLS
jgi:hypothetical protein